MIDHNVIIAIVAIELAFAFSVGIVCILFSFNLLRAIKESPDEDNLTLTHGNFPPSRGLLRGNSFAVNNTTTEEIIPFTTDHGRQMSKESELDEEIVIDPQVYAQSTTSLGLVQSFASYLRLW
eukprot:gene3216-3525_t